ncbi:MAG TPA: hypothetical protein VHV51_16175 [Polyangiaceae bacterium]|jgi:hypothetical protein|nr:hypothetical protein [Polyangiaceae bacterium]
MTIVTLRIEPEFCGPFSVGTVVVVKLVARYFGLGLKDALNAVDRAVFDAETVELAAPSLEAAQGFVAEIRALPAAPRVSAEFCA